jgi:hypothetical protein
MGQDRKLLVKIASSYGMIRQATKALPVFN